ncbi:MAG: hypothetical protein V1897_08655, partial [Pseudomonadota bacterium]
MGSYICDGEGKQITLFISKVEIHILNKTFYKGKVFEIVCGVLHKGLSTPLWIMTNLKTEEGLDIYFQRMKIEDNLRFRNVCSTSIIS